MHGYVLVISCDSIGIAASAVEQIPSHRRLIEGLTASTLHYVDITTTIR